MRGDLFCGPCGAASRLFLTVRFAPARGPAYGGLSAKSAASGASRGRGRGRTFRVNEKYQKVTQGTTFLENPPSLRGCFVTLRPLDFRSVVGALGRCRCLLLRTVLLKVLVASRYSARGSGVWGANLQVGSLERVPFAGSLSLKGRQPEFYKYQSG